MRRFISALILVLILPVMLFCGCTTSSPKETVTIYKVNGDIFEKKQVEVESITYGVLLAEMKKESVVPNNVGINKFSLSEKTADITIDFNGNFASHIKAQTKESQKLIVQAVANTFLRNFNLNTLILTAERSPIITEENDFSKVLYSFESGAVYPDGYMEIEETTEETTKPEAVDVVADNTPEQSEKKKRVALTFDDGPHETYTRLIVDKLKEYDAHATFFVVGNRMNGVSGDAIKYAHENGNEIAVHGYTHDYYYDSCSEEKFREELQKTEDTIIKYTGVKPTLMRPIGGNTTDERNSMSGYAVILWNNDSNDWRYKAAEKGNVDAIVSNVMNNIADGRIILMHEIYENSWQAFCIIIKKLDKMGYEIVTVSELLGEENIKPGVQYRGG